MPKTQLTSKRLRQPNGHFSQATMIEAKGPPRIHLGHDVPAS